MKYNCNSSRKTKKKNLFDFILQDTPVITKTWEIAIFFLVGGEVLWGPGNQCGIQRFFMILWISESFSLYLLVKNSFKFKLRFFTHFEYISGVSSERTFYIRITIVPGDMNTKKTRKIFNKLHIKFFLNAILWILHCHEHLWLKTFVKIYFQVVKIEKMTFLE